MEKERLEAERDDAVSPSRSLTIPNGDIPSKKRERSEAAERDDTGSFPESVTRQEEERPSKKQKV